MKFLFIVLILICSKPTKGISQDSAYILMDKMLDSIVLLGIDSQAFPGAQILVRHKDSIIYHKTWGHHTYDQKREVRRSDLYDMASVSKVSTGLPILMKWHGEKILDLDAPIKKYFKSLKRSNKKNLTLREVLSHQAGLEPYLVFWKNAQKKNGKYKCKTFKDSPSKKYSIRITDSLFLHRNYNKKMEKQIRKSPLRSDPQYLYSGLTFLLLPKMISEFRNVSFEQYLYNEIYRPITASNLLYNPLKKFTKDQIVPTEFDSLWRRQLVHGEVHDEAAAMLNGVSCNAGLFGNAEDLSKLFQLYLNKGKWDNKQIISASAIEEFTSYQYADNRRGLGFDKPLRPYDEALAYISKDASAESYGHSGFTGTMVWADPEYDLVFVFLSNRVYPSRSHTNLYRLSLRPAMHQKVYDYILKIRESIN